MILAVTHLAVDRHSAYNFEDFNVLSIGRFSYIDGNALIHHFAEKSTVAIGQFSSIASNTAFFLRANHRSEWITTYPIAMMPWPAALPKPAHPHKHGKGDITIGNDVWVGEGARFLPGVRVGDGAIIGTGTVVTKDVPAYAVFGGNPGRVRKMRMSARDIKDLLEIRWWDLPTPVIAQLAPAICSTNVAALKDAIAKDVRDVAPSEK
jgi:acetyltransferase-like isoleucine patch superfamily enzyme